MKPVDTSNVVFVNFPHLKTSSSIEKVPSSWIRSSPECLVQHTVRPDWDDICSPKFSIGEDQATIVHCSRNIEVWQCHTLSNRTHFAPGLMFEGLDIIFYDAELALIKVKHVSDT